MSRLAVPGRLLAGTLVVGAAAGGLAVARGPGRATTYAGSSALAAALAALAALLLAAAGWALTGRPRTRRTGAAVWALAVAWSAPAWVAWTSGPPLVRSVAMLLGGFALVLVARLALGGRALPTRVLYAEAAAAAAVLAVVRDPYLDPGCWANCAVNSLLVTPRPSLARAVETGDRWFTGAAGLLLAGLCAVRLARGSRAARPRDAPVLLPVIVFAGAATARAAAVQRLRVEDPFAPALRTAHLAQCAALALLAGGLLWRLVRERTTRAAVDRIAASLGDAPAPGTVEAALAGALRDSALRITYRLSGSEAYVDADGRRVDLPEPGRGRMVTRLADRGRTIAVIDHANTDLEAQLGPAVRLGLENERLQAQALAQVEALRASRARIVESADRARRTLERDLHDGAQQHLLALSYDVRLARSAASGPATAQLLDQAMAETEAALDELRGLAHGIYPAVLRDAGLRAAVESLADAAPVAMDVRAGGERYAAPVEAAAYFAIVAAVDDAAGRDASRTVVTLARRDGRLLVTVEDDGAARAAPLPALAERVGALGGTLSPGPTAYQFEIPCA
jgi:signal transduction histidine kinase